MYEKIVEFDKNNKERLYNLFVLKGEAIQKGLMLARQQGVVQGESFHNFYMSISDQIDSPRSIFPK